MPESISKLLPATAQYPRPNPATVSHFAASADSECSGVAPITYHRRNAMYKIGISGRTAANGA
jgi:hypothetical protein